MADTPLMADNPSLTDSNATPVRRALLSVSDKTGIVEFARGLTEHGVELLSTGGTFRLLQENAIAVKEVSEHTGFPEITPLPPR